MIIEEFKLVNKYPVIATFDVFFEDKGFGIREFKLMETNGTRWIGHPSRSYKDAEGKTKYFQFSKFTNRDRKDRFDKTVMEMLNPFLTRPKADSPKNLDEEIPF